MASTEESSTDQVTGTGPSRFWTRLRNYFLTGLVIAAPVLITIWIVWWLVSWVDGFIKPMIPWQYNPDHYLPFPVPGFGLLVALIALTLLGLFAANLIGRTLVSFGELAFERTPVVSTIYRGSRQIFETFFSTGSKPFRSVGLIEFPRPGVWSLAFIATKATGEIAEKLSAETGEEMLTVLIPPAPAPTAGYFAFVKASEVIHLDMSVEDAAKIVLSAGVVIPPYKPAEIKQLKPPTRLKPPSVA